MRTPYGALVLALAALLGVPPAGANPVFSPTFDVEVENFGGAATSGPHVLPFDGETHDVPGTNFRAGAIATPSAPVFGETAGWVETWIESDVTLLSGVVDGGGLSSVSAAFRGAPLPPPDPDIGGGRLWSTASQSFMYFTLAGNVVDISDALSQGLAIGAHPTNPAITDDVYFFGSANVSIGAGGPGGGAGPTLALDAAVFNVPYSVLEFALGFNQTGGGADAVHLGVQVRYSCDGEYLNSAACNAPVATPLAAGAPLALPWLTVLLLGLAMRRVSRP